MCILIDRARETNTTRERDFTRGTSGDDPVHCGHASNLFPLGRDPSASRVRGGVGHGHTSCVSTFRRVCWRDELKRGQGKRPTVSEGQEVSSRRNHFRIGGDRSSLERRVGEWGLGVVYSTRISVNRVNRVQNQ